VGFWLRKKRGLEEETREKRKEREVGCSQAPRRKKREKRALSSLLFSLQLFSLPLYLEANWVLQQRELP